MTDKEIIAKGKETIEKRIKKGLDCCEFEYPPCRHCPYQICGLRDCKKILIKDAKYLVETQQKEIDRLKEENDKNFEKWEILDKRTKERYAELYEEAKGVVRAEAIKEFKCNLIEQIEYIEDAHQAEYKDDFGKGWMAGFSTATHLIRGAIDYIAGFENRGTDNG